MSTSRIIAFSDTHNKHEELDLPTPQKGDILVFAGDMCLQGHDREVYRFVTWLSKLGYENKIVIAGNHDIPFDSSSYCILKELFTPESRVTYLQNSGVWCQGLYFWGSPVTPSFGNLAFNVTRSSEQLREHWERIPKHTDVLITHGPPAHILDLGIPGKDGSERKCGCEHLLERLEIVKPKIHIFGHIHENYGKVRSKHTEFYNVSVLDNKYKMVNPPTIIELRTWDKNADRTTDG